MAKYCKLKVESLRLKVLSLSLTLTLALALSSCQEGREAGDLLGQWRMADSDSKYISFSGSITEFRHVQDGALKRYVFGNFQHVADSLFIQCYSINEEWKTDDVEMIENTFEMKPFHNIRVKIEVLDNKHLILSKDGKMWNFYKY